MQFSILWNGWASILNKTVYVKKKIPAISHYTLLVLSTEQQKKTEEKKLNKKQMKSYTIKNVYIKQKRST